jgi:hypothetical protein
MVVIVVVVVPPAIVSCAWTATGARAIAPAAIPQTNRPTVFFLQRIVERPPCVFPTLFTISSKYCRGVGTAKSVPEHL